MPRKTIIIFIVVFLLVGAIMLGAYSYFKNTSSPTADPNASLYQKFNPFGTSTKNPSGTGEGDTTTSTTTGETEKPVSKFYQISNFGISGAAFLEDNRKVTQGDSTTEPTYEVVPSVRYVERATGHIYQTYLDTKVTGTISNSTIPGVYEVLFDGLANSTIYRYPSTDGLGITSFLATLGGSSSFLPTNILSVSLSPDKTSFFSITKGKNGVIGTIKSFDSSKNNQVFTSSFSEWLPQWVTNTNIYLTTKPTYLVEGSVFNLNTTNGTLSKLFGGIPGLTTLANGDGNYVLFGASLDTGPTLNVFDIKNHISIDLGVYGLPEKCVWSKDNVNVYCAVPNTIVGTQYPDTWYQGLTSFTDYFVKINTETKEVSTLANSQNETGVDATNLFLNDKEDKLFFTNKKDYTFWSLDL
ncbi:hypothetical protein HXX01_00135 [Candidatus Nomurabacteria bacterium]|nr:hypothetical protein [Candidatus Nomurabacteria bacterium]